MTVAFLSHIFQMVIDWRYPLLYESLSLSFSLSLSRHLKNFFVYSSTALCHMHIFRKHPASTTCYAHTMRWKLPILTIDSLTLHISVSVSSISSIKRMEQIGNAHRQPARRRIGQKSRYSIVGIVGNNVVVGAQVRFWYEITWMNIQHLYVERSAQNAIRCLLFTA